MNLRQGSKWVYKHTISLCNYLMIEAKYEPDSHHISIMRMAVGGANV